MPHPYQSLAQFSRLHWIGVHVANKVWCLNCPILKQGAQEKSPPAGTGFARSVPAAWVLYFTLRRVVMYDHVMHGDSHYKTVAIFFSFSDTPDSIIHAHKSIFRDQKRPELHLECQARIQTFGQRVPNPQPARQRPYRTGREMQRQ